MARSQIEWTEMTWNPVTGCTKISPGCKYCYAEVMAKRLQAMGVAKYRNGFRVTLHPEALSLPYRWKQPRIIFVNSMSDLFHEEIPVSFFQRIFQVMNDCSQHVFQVLTKRAERILELERFINWSSNIWMGVSVESERYLFRVDYLRRSGAKMKFLSLEPLLGPLSNLELTGIDWVIVGGESGPKARPMRKEWVLEIKELCEKAGIPFFFKQWGGRNKRKAGRELDGRIYDNIPIARQLSLKL
ncbi:MAG: phage Gp37/Gp68 family protein [Calditrichaeota bacterium]|nr:MAG: phage Gp37/Gp68 family protein [Calditrichota bacterium]